MTKQDVRASFDWMARNSVFVFTFIGVMVVSVLALIKGADIIEHLIALLGMNTGHSLTKTVSGHWAASRDDKVDSGALIRQMEGLPQLEEDDSDDPGLESSLKPDFPD